MFEYPVCYAARLRQINSAQLLHVQEKPDAAQPHLTPIRLWTEIP